MIIRLQLFLVLTLIIIVLIIYIPEIKNERPINITKEIFVSNEFGKMRNYFLKQAPYRRKILHSKDKVIPIQNILVPEV